MVQWYLVRYGDSLERYWVFEDRDVALAWIARNGGAVDPVPVTRGSFVADLAPEESPEALQH